MKSLCQEHSGLFRHFWGHFGLYHEKVDTVFIDLKMAKLFYFKMGKGSASENIAQGKLKT